MSGPFLDANTPWLQDCDIRVGFSKITRQDNRIGIVFRDPAVTLLKLTNSLQYTPLFCDNLHIWLSNCLLSRPILILTSTSSG